STLVADDPARARERGWLQFRVAVLLRAQDPRRGLGYIDLARQAAYEAGDRVLEMSSLFVRGLLRCFANDPGRGVPALATSVAAGRASARIATRHAISDAHYGLAHSYAWLGQPELATEYYERALAGYISFGHHLLIYATWILRLEDLFVAYEADDIQAWQQYE